ncbi:calcium-binding protein [uncultured Albimonas sp.]|uniref:calcium-binding protein n=1 Tax=uncultured Albimonas sp. TaxID=1331701 RepID=UPI0030EEE015
MPLGLGSLLGWVFGGLQGRSGSIFGIDFDFGTVGADALYGDGQGTVAAGTPMGHDVIVGFASGDLIVGDAERLGPAAGETAATSPATFAGDDLLYGGDGDDVIYGDFQADPSSLYAVHLGDDVIYGGAGNDTIYTDAVSVLADSAGNNRAYGGEGDDRIRGGEGIDRLYGGEGDDVIYADGQSGTAAGATPTWNLLDGGEGADSLYGGAGEDVIYGGGGDDVLGGEGGDDRLVGGKGADEFEYFMGGGADLIVDFKPGEDLLVLISDIGAPLPAADFAGIMGLTTDLGRDLLIDLGGGSSVTLARTDADDLSASDFLILA